MTRNNSGVFTHGVKSGLKFFFIGFVILLLLIPLALVEGIITEREHLSDKVSREIAETWGGEQRILGPIVMVPYQEDIVETVPFNPDGSTTQNATKTRVVRVNRTAYFLPKTLNVSASLKPDIRYRSIYQSVVYQSPVQLSGKFEFKPPDDTASKNRQWDWAHASLFMGVGDVRGIQHTDPVQWNGTPRPFESSIHQQDIQSVGLQASLGALESGKSYNFTIKTQLNGHKDLKITPVGENNHFTLTSPWTAPSYVGGFLPNTREQTANGFNAQWEISHFARSYPQVMTTETLRSHLNDIQSSAAGVSLITTVDFYQKLERSVKYGVLFIALTFLTFFIFEVILRTRIHLIQYVLVGIALCLFYLLLLSFSELIGFNWAYLVATLPTVGLITLYTFGIAKQRKVLVAMVMAVVLLALYGYLFTLLQLEDYALVCGTIGLFIALATVMIVTRNIDWYGGEADASSGGTPPSPRVTSTGSDVPHSSLQGPLEESS